MSEIIGATAQQVLEGIASSGSQEAGESISHFLRRMQLERSIAEEQAEIFGDNWPIERWYENFAKDADRISEMGHQPSPEYKKWAEEAYQQWKQSGGQTSKQGSATQHPKVATNPQTAIKKSGATTASIGGLLSMSLPTWVAAAAPLLGVAVGVGLYEASPQLWEKISRKLLPFCYPDSEVMPVVTDEDGNTYIDKEAVEALKELFDEEGIGGESGGTNPGIAGEPSVVDYIVAKGTSSTTLDPDATPLFIADDIVYYAYTSDVFKAFSINGYIVLAGTAAFTFLGFRNGEFVSTKTSGSNGYTYDGRRVTYGSIGNYTESLVPDNGTEWSGGIGPAAWIAEYGEPTGEYPEGTQRWGGMMVDISQLPINEVYTDPTGENTREFIPVALPTEPGESLDPEENPDPTQNEDPEEQISPYILPTDPSEGFPEGSRTDEELTDIAPIPMPFPDTNPDTNPDADPSQPDDQPPQKLVDVIPPIDSGDITFPTNPLPGDPDNVDGGVGGLVSVYNPTYSELQAFSQWLWVTYADATIDKIWNNPFDGVISLHELYATPNKGARKYIKSGFLVSPVNSITIPNRYSEINCGSAIFPEYYGNYLDYSPYTKALCYLPFIGIVELNPDDIIGHAVNIRYRVDSYSGACIALLECAREGSNAVLYQFSGNCSVQMPIAGGTQASIKAAQISAGAYQNAYHVAGLAGMAGGILGGIGSLLSGNIGGAISNAVHGLGSYATNQAFGQANAISQTVSAKSSVQHSGQFGESFGAMGAKKPYMIIKRPVQVIVNNYQNEYGYQAHKYVTIGECTGYLRCRGVHFASARATDDEKQAVERALMEGVLVT